jgi:hypothetical protein
MASSLCFYENFDAKMLIAFLATDACFTIHPLYPLIVAVKKEASLLIKI